MRPGRSPCSHRSISTAPLAGPQMWQISGSRVIRQMTRSGLHGINVVARGEHASSSRKREFVGPIESIIRTLRYVRL